MRYELRLLLRKYLVLLTLGLLAYFVGWILGTRLHNTRELAAQTRQKNEMSEAGRNVGTGLSGRALASRR